MSFRVKADDMLDAYMKVNNIFIHQPYEFLDHVRTGVTAHHMVDEITINSGACDVHLHQVGYTRAKWNMLMNLYFEPQDFSMMIGRLKYYMGKMKKGYVPNIAMQFRDRENRSGACLLAISLGKTVKRGWELEVFTRASEVSSRWPADLIFVYVLLKEIGTYCKFKPEEVKIHWHASSMYQSIISAPLFLALSNQREWLDTNLPKMNELYGVHPWQYAILKRYEKCFLNEGYTYKSQVRASKAFHAIEGEEMLEPVWTDDLKLPAYDLIELTDDFFKRGGFR